MKTIVDIIACVTSVGCDCEESCSYCQKINWCNVDSILLALDYLYNNQY